MNLECATCGASEFGTPSLSVADGNSSTEARWHFHPAEGTVAKSANSHVLRIRTDEAGNIDLNLDHIV